MSRPSKVMVPAVGSNQLEQTAPEGGLAAARLTHQPQRLSLLEIEADAIHRMNRILLAQEAASQPEVLFQIPDR